MRTRSFEAMATPVRLGEPATAAWTELGGLLVDVTEAGGAAHDAAGDVAVEQPVGVAELVDGLLDDPLAEAPLAEELQVLAQARRGGHRHPASQLRLPEDVGEDGDEEVLVGQPEDAAVR